MDCGLPPHSSELQNAAKCFVERVLEGEQFRKRDWLLRHAEISYCRLLAQELAPTSVLKMSGSRTWRKPLLYVRMQDGAWNCRIRQKPKTHHSSFHTTFNVLEGLRAAALAGIISESAFQEVEAQALQFMLAHKMYRSDKTGEIISDRFLHLTYPSHWHYTVLRGLDYMHITPAIADCRLDDPIEYLLHRRDKNGRWPVEKRIPGTTLFDMEKWGGESRWNTLSGDAGAGSAGKRGLPQVS